MIGRDVRTLTVGRMATARLRAGWRSYAPLWLGFVVAIALVSAVSEAGHLSGAAALQGTISGLHERGVVEVKEAGYLGPAVYADFRAGVARRVHGDLHGYLRLVGTRAQSRVYDVSSRNGVPDVSRNGEFRDVLTFAAHVDLDRKADLVAGAWPGPRRGSVIEGTLSEPAASQTGLRPGDVACLQDGLRADAFCVRVTGVWRQRSAGDPSWAADDPLPVEVEVSSADLFEALGTAEATQQVVALLQPDIGAIQRADPDHVVTALSTLRPALGGNQPGWTVQTDLDSAIATFLERQRVAAFALQLIAAQLWLLALYAVLFLAGLRLAEDARTIAVWRTRGWSRGGISALLAAELVMVAAAALPFGVGAGLLTAWKATGLAYPRGQAALRPVLAPVLGPLGMAAAVGMALILLQVGLAARRSVLGTRTAASRPRPAWWQRGRFAVVAGLAAVPVLAEARLLGSARLRAAGGDQPYDLLLPGLGIGLGALAGIRLLPLAGRAGGAVARGFEQRLASLQLRRAAGRQEALALLLIATVGIGILAAAYSGTASRNAADRAAYAAGADVRATARGSLPVDLERLPAPGATGRSQVFRSYARPGSARDDVPVLGVDPFSFAGVAWQRPDLPGVSLPDLMHELVAGEKGGILLPSTASGLAIQVRGDGTGGQLTARLTDAGGQPVGADFGTLDFSGWRLLRAGLRPVSRTYRPPLRFRELTLSPADRAGTIALTRLTASDASRAEAAVLEPFAHESDPLVSGVPGWWMTDGERGSRLGRVPISDRFPLDGDESATVHLEPGWLPVHLAPPASRLASLGALRLFVPTVVPALVTPDILAANRVRIGDPLAIRVDNTAVNATVVGTVDYFPTLYGSFMVLAADPMLAVLGEEGYGRPWPDELWLRVGSGDQARAVAALAARPDIADARSADGLRAERATDPMLLAGRVNLVLGFGAALVLAVAAFGVHYLVAARARQAEYAVLQANGMSEAQVRRSLAAEQATLLLLSVAGGLALGGLGAAVLLPSLEVGTAVQDNVPPTLLAVDLRMAAAALLAVLGGCLLAGRVSARISPAADLMGELRSLR